MHTDDQLLREQEGKTGFAVAQKTDCPHIDKHLNNDLPEIGQIFKKQCKDCGEDKENWVCLECGDVCCSRYVKGDMAKHSQETGHIMASSLMDLSVWCYECGDYIDNPDVTLQILKKKLEHAKFPPNDPNVDLKINAAIDDMFNHFKQ